MTVQLSVLVQRLSSPLLGGEAADARWLLLPVEAAASCPALCCVRHGWHGAGQAVQGVEEITSP